MIYNTNVDLINDNVYTKFGLNPSIYFQDIEQKVQFQLSSPISNSSEILWMSLLPASMKKIQSKKDNEKPTGIVLYLHNFIAKYILKKH